jgi:hypothetical protein
MSTFKNLKYNLHALLACLCIVICISAVVLWQLQLDDSIRRQIQTEVYFLRGDQIGLFKLVTLNCILNRITGVTFGC